MLWLYLLILLVLAAALWGVYRLLGTPSKLAPTDYQIVLADVAVSVEKAASQLRQVLDGAPGADWAETAKEARKIFQTGYYQTLRLRPATGSDQAADIRAELGRACEAYDWASRMVGSESSLNPLILEAARGLMDAGDIALRQAVRALSPAQPAPRENSALSP
jgi:hypothetical protein